MLIDHYRIVILVAIIAIALVAVYANSHPMQLGNNMTLVVEVGVGIIIAIIVYARSRKNERKMEKVVYTIQDIVQGEQSIRDKHTEVITEQLLEILDDISRAAAQIIDLPPGGTRRNIELQPSIDHDNLAKKIVSQSKNISEMKTALYQHIPDQARAIMALCELCESLQESIKAGVCVTVKNNADALIQNLAGEHTERVGQASHAAGGDQMLSIALDRNEYPIGGTVHVWTQTGTPRANGEISYKVANEKGKVVYDSKDIPADQPDEERTRKGAFDHRIQLKGRRWKSGKYGVIASQGDSSTTARFSIVKRTPIIQSDKDMYMAGSDMIVTVIDPGSNKDGFEVEYVGNSDDSKLVIESDHGKIDGYSLRETGKSTGIFQGIVGILRARADGSVACHDFGGKKIDKTQGTGIEDGFIACERGGDIRIRYTSRSGSVSYTVFASNFGATVELDQLVYSCTGRVRITAVAPDLNLDPERRDTMGDDGECTLSVRTSLGELRGYRLIESGTDTGIFEGSITLTGFAGDAHAGPDAIPRGTTGGRSGPGGGLLACSHEDKLVIELSMGAGDTYEASAIIRWNVGEIMFLKNTYRMGDSATVRVVDPDMIVDPDGLNTLSVHISSGSDKTGFNITARDYQPGTGVFEGSFLVDAADSAPSDSKIRACHGDTLQAEYIDSTLPSPYSPHDKIVVATSARVLEASGDLPPSPLERAKLTGIVVRNERGDRLPIMDGDTASITVNAVRMGGPRTFTAVVNVSSSSGAGLDLLAADLDIGPDGTASHTFRWSPTHAGVFHVTAHLWESLKEPVPLCTAISQSVNVVGSDSESHLR